MAPANFRHALTFIHLFVQYGLLRHTHTHSKCALWRALMAALCSCAWRIFISHLTTVVVCLSSSLSRLLFPGNGRTQNIHFMCVYMLANKNVICGLRCARYPKLQKEWARKKGAHASAQLRSIARCIWICRYITHFLRVKINNSPSIDQRTI